MTVAYLQRARNAGYSIERLFADVRSGLPGDIQAGVYHAPHSGASASTVLRNSLWARGLEADVYHVTGDAYYLATPLASRRTVLTILDCVGYRRLTGVKRAVFDWLWYRLPISRAAVVTVISGFVREELLARVPSASDKVRVVHCCVSPMLKPVPMPDLASQPTLLQVGTERHKNIERTAEALRGIPCHYRIIGVLRPEQEQALRENGIGFSAASGLSDEAMRAEYEAAHAVLFASTYEGFGLPIAEAQAVGRPVVTSNVCSMPEVGGDGACYVDPFDPGSIRNGVSRVLTDSAYRNQLFERGLENVRRFRASVIAGQYAELYRGIAESR